MEHQHKFFVNHRTFWPNIVGGENAQFFDSKAFENSFDIFGVNIFSFLGNDHVFLAARELQVAHLVETPEVAGQEPTFDDGFRREFRLIQIARHDGLAANSNFANAVNRRIHDAYFHSRQRLANGICAKRFQIVDRDGSAGFRESISVGDGNTKIVEKLQRLRFAKSTANNYGAEFSAKRFMDLFKQAAADTETRPALGEYFVDADEHI